MTVEYVHGYLDLGIPSDVRYWPEWSLTMHSHLPYPSATHNAILASAQVEECSACEGGYSLPKSERDIAATKAIAAKRGLPHYNYKPFRDLRFAEHWHGTKNWVLYMADDMPWTRAELDDLLSAMKEEDVPVQLVIDATHDMPADKDESAGSVLGSWWRWWTKMIHG